VEVDLLAQLEALAGYSLAGNVCNYAYLRRGDEMKVPV